MKSWTHLTLQKIKEQKREKSLRASFQRVVKMSYIKVFVHWWKSEKTPMLHHHYIFTVSKSIKVMNDSNGYQCNICVSWYRKLLYTYIWSLPGNL